MVKRSSHAPAADTPVADGMDRGEPAGRAAPRNRSSSLRRAIAVLDFVADFQNHKGGLRLGDLAVGLGLPKSTLVRLLAPLIESGLVSMAADTGRYRLGPRTAYLGGIYLEQLDLRSTARDVLADLVSQSGETAHLVVRDGLEIVYIDKVESPKATSVSSRIGSRQPLYCTAVGKAFLAHLPELFIMDVEAAGMLARTPNTLTTHAELRRELALVSARGYSVITSRTSWGSDASEHRS